MELCLLRHGIAEDQALSGRDEDRRLTDEGRHKLRAVMRLALHAGVKPDLILSSPYIRAMQTAEIAGTDLNYTGDLVRTSALTPEADPRAVWEEIRTYRNLGQLMLVSHNPLCSSLSGYLLGTPGFRIEFRKAGLLRVSFQQFGAEPRGVLQWLITPKLAEALP